MNKIPSFTFFLKLSKVHAIISRRFASQGLGFADIAVMYQIDQAPLGKIRRVDLANALGLTASGVTRMLLPLEKIGVVKREEDARDGRVSFTTLTASGKRMLQESLDSAELTSSDIIPQGKQKLVAEFSEFLEKIM